MSSILNQEVRKIYSVSEDFLEALEHNAVQHIRGTLTTVSGTEIALDDTVLADYPTFEKQMTSSQEVFNFGEIFVGSAEITVVLPDISLNEIKGGEFTLETGISLLSGGIEWIPLGVWDIVSANRQTSDILQIKGYDHMNRLGVPMNMNVVSTCTLSAAMEIITQRTGVEFAQTAEEISSSIPSGEPYSATFANTCLDEVRMISQFVGGFAFADRHGRIYIKRLSLVEIEPHVFRPEIVLNIPAERRFSAKISECRYIVDSVSYTDSFGVTVSASGSGTVQTTLGFSDNRYMWDTDEDPYKQYRNRALSRIINHFRSFSWHPGTVEYYGNPALDLGDIITIEDGVTGSGNSVKFLITSILWKFRSPQTLISAGAPESGNTTSSSSSSSGTVTTAVTVVTSKNIEKVDLRIFPGELAGGSVLLAGGGFSVRSRTRVFVEFSLVLQGIQDSIFTGEVYIDDELFYPVIKQTLHEDEYSFIRITVPFDAPAATHKIELYASGYAVPENCSAYVWGQNLTAESPQLTDESDYTYTIKNGTATVTGYLGSILYPRIPEYLENAPVTVIGKGAFTDTDVTAVYIPDGTAEIK